MEWWQVLLAVVLVGLLVLAIGAIVVWKLASDHTKRLASRIGRLPVKGKLRLAKELVFDDRIPFLLRLVPPALLLYLSMPLDIVPDFVPVLGQLDDVLVVAIGVGLLLRLTPVQVLEAHLSSIELRYSAGRPSAPA